MNKEELIQFEDEIKELYLNAKIRSPVHFCGGNEEQLIEIFKKVNLKDDWVFSTHRSHYHALLKGIPKEWLRNEILENRSIHINNKEHKFMSSAIVGGCLPIALGVSMAIKRNRIKDWVWIFVGDMGAETGVFHECTKYATRNDLPISFVIEDNGLATYTPTQEVWGTKKGKDRTIRLQFTRTYPHYGLGKFIPF